MKQNLEYEVERGYKSVGEAIIGETLQRQGVDFTYEKQLLVEDQRPGDTEKARLWYPDFSLNDLGIVIEYIGSDDQDYLKGIEKKTQTYEKMGLKVIKIYGKDVFEIGRDGKPHKRKDFEHNLLMSIYEKARESGIRGRRTKQALLQTNIIEGYLYRSGRVAA